MTVRAIKREVVVEFLSNLLHEHNKSLKHCSKLKKDLEYARDSFALSDETIQSMQDEFAERMEIDK